MDNLNLEIFSFQQKLNDLINSSQLEASIIYYIIKNLYWEIEKQYYDILREEYKQYSLNKQNVDINENGE